MVERGFGMRVLLRVGLVIACVSAGQSVAFAQASLAGVVRDVSGAVLPGVTVGGPAQRSSKRFEPPARSIGEEDIRFGGQRLTVGADFYNLANNNVTLGFNGAFVPNVSGWNAPTSDMNPRIFRLNAEFSWSIQFG